MIALLFDVAVAGKLADGFQGIPYGDTARMASAPLATCVRAPSADTWWVCDHVLGSAPVKVAFVKMEETYVGFMMTAEGYSTCSDLLTTLKAAYGAGRPKHDWQADEAMADRMWSDGTAYGAFEYNQFSGACQFLGASLTVMDEVQAKQKARTAKAVEGL